MNANKNIVARNHDEVLLYNHMTEGLWWWRPNKCMMVNIIWCHGMSHRFVEVGFELAISWSWVRHNTATLHGRGVTIHKSRFGTSLGFQVTVLYVFWYSRVKRNQTYIYFLFDFDVLNCIKQMPYTHEKTSNTIEDKNTLKSRTYFHCGPQHKTSGQGKKLKNKNLVRTEMKRASNPSTLTCRLPGGRLEYILRKWSLPYVLSVWK